MNVCGNACFEKMKAGRMKLIFVLIYTFLTWEHRDMDNRDGNRDSTVRLYHVNYGFQAFVRQLQIHTASVKLVNAFDSWLV